MPGEPTPPPALVGERLTERHEADRRLARRVVQGMLALAVLIAAPAGWRAWQVRKPTMAASYFRLLGGTVDWTSDSPSWRADGTTQVDLSSASSQVGNADLARLKELHRLTSLSLVRCWRISDAGLAHLVGLRDLEELDLARSPESGYAAPGPDLSGEGLT